MCAKASDAVAEPECHELAEMRDHWWWFLVLGLGLIVLGTVAISAPFITGLVGVTFLGVLMLMGGVAQVVSAFWEGQWKGFFLHLLSGLLYVVVGALVVKGLDSLRHEGIRKTVRRGVAWAQRR